MKKTQTTTTKPTANTKLILSRESIRALSDQALTLVDGGAIGRRPSFDSATTC